MVTTKKHPIGKILVAMKFATVEQVKEALHYQKNEAPDWRIGEIMRKLGTITDEQVSRALAKQHGVPFVDLGDGSKIHPNVLHLASPDQVKEYGVIPVRKDGNVLTVASGDALEYFEMDNLRFIFGSEVRWAVATPQQLQAIAFKFYEVDEGIKGFFDKDKSSAINFNKLDADDIEVDAEDDDGVVAQLVQTIISDAINRRASDIHVEPMEEKLRIRYRVDGSCQEMECPPKRLQGSIISRIKILSNMDIAEKRVPQDGRIRTGHEGRDIDLRVSALPCSYGESVVMRILDKQKNLVSVEQLGMHPSDFERFSKLLSKPNGVFLVTGPTGSGKTTTLYASLQMLNRPDLKIITAEDPVEYNISGINQSQVRHGIGLTFASILKSMLRQAPNIILVGEIRDHETAQIAIQASLTGHLVFSTLHTNDAPSSLTRLVNMGVKPFLVASAVQAILAQRLIKRICQHCRRSYTPGDDELKQVGFTKEQATGKVFYEAVGCNKCNGVGYKGRMGVYELLVMDMRIRELLFQGADNISLRQAAVEGGMSTLQNDGMRKVLNGVSTVDEVLEITHDQSVG